MGAKLLQRMLKLNNNWKYTFLRPTLTKIIERYNLKFKPSEQPPSPAAPRPRPPPPPPPPPPPWFQPRPRNDL